MPAIESLSHARSGLWTQLADARKQTDEIFALVKPQFLYERPIAERHRIVFYIGHLEAFDWNLLNGRVLGRKSFHPEFDRLFAFGIDPVGGGLPSDQPADWPSLHHVRGYVQGVRDALDESVESALAEENPPQTDGFALTTLLNVAIEHRLMHAETLAYMFHQLPLAQKIHRNENLQTTSGRLFHQPIQIPAGDATLGLARSSGAFGWDNEFESHSVHVPAFAIDKYKVTNGQYLEFLESGGYQARELWQDADWAWKSQQSISHPAFWKQSGDQWLYRTMFEELPLPTDWPAYVSQAEAKAYARWKGKALPTEAEWHRAAYGTADGGERSYPWGDSAPAPELGNFDFERWSPTSVDAFPQAQSGFGVHDMMGNGWEWTSTEFGPFAGFARFPFYPGYSADFFDGKHFVMKGGSARTAASMLRRSFRNWFQSHYPYMYAGFRCVQR